MGRLSVTTAGALVAALGCAHPAGTTTSPGALLPTTDLAAEKAAIKSVIRASAAAVTGCYDDYLARAPTANELTVHVRFVISPSGDVARASIVEPAPIEDAFAACLLGVFRAMEFGPADTGSPRRVDYPFRFTRGR